MAAASLAQTQPAAQNEPVFEVASIKPARPGGKPSLRAYPGGRTVATNATLKYLITLAYNVRDYQITGGPGWIASKEYDIEAKPMVAFQPSYDTRAYAMKMLQALLEDRFKLTISFRLKERPAPQRPSDMRMSGGKGLMIGQGVPISILAESLAGLLGRPVTDATGLKGYYDFRLVWAPDETNAGEPPADRTGPSIFTAIQEQLGLKVEARKGPVEILVIENAAQPSEN